jgi:hypothetical protein
MSSAKAPTMVPSNGSTGGIVFASLDCSDMIYRFNKLFWLLLFPRWYCSFCSWSYSEAL